MLEELVLPTQVTLVRTTPVFDETTMPDGIRRAHRLAADVWGKLVVEQGSVTYVLESNDQSREISAGQSQVIEPDTPHHVELGPDARFSVAFYR